MDLNLSGKSKSFLDIYRSRQIILICMDIFIVIISYLTSVSLINESMILPKSLIFPMLIYIMLNTLSLYLLKCYSSLWRYSGDKELLYIAAANVIYIIPLIFINNFLGYQIPFLFYLTTTLLILAGTIGSRVIYRYLRRVRNYLLIRNDEVNSRVLVVGGGSAGALIIKELFENPDINKVPIAIIDDNKSKHGRRLYDIPIVGSTEDISKIVKKYDIDEIIISIANIDRERKQKIIKLCKKTNCKLKTIPGIYEIIDGKVDIKNIRDVNIEELLGRDEIKTNLKEINKYVSNKTVLVTGGGGSIGSELCRQISEFNPKKLVIFDIYENNAYEIQQELIRKYEENLDLEVIIASVRDTKRLDKIFNKYKPQVVFHAAAHKHVPLMEKSPCEAIKNNIFGTMNVAQMASKYSADKFVLISTDKAVNPTNIMGATKRAAEMIIQTLNKNSNTEFVAVRFGNVLGSNGSVIPLFKKQIEEGGPITVTHPEITRFFMTIPEAVSLVMQAGAMAKGGEIFVLDMGKPVKIVDLAHNLISLSGLEPGVDIKIEYSGLRPGEKLYEELLMDEEGLTSTSHNKIFIGKPINLDQQKLKINLELLNKIVINEEIELIEPIIKNIVPTYVRRENEKVNEVAITS